MFENLTARLQETFRKLRGKGKLSEADVDEALREIRIALLEADVNFKVVRDFVAKVRERAVGSEVAASLTPGQQVIKIVNSELTLSTSKALATPFRVARSFVPGENCSGESVKGKTLTSPRLPWKVVTLPTAMKSPGISLPRRCSIKQSPLWLSFRAVQNKPEPKSLWLWLSCLISQ
jgi:hypothetical protein